jgi:hypothetical protein
MTAVKMLEVVGGRIECGRAVHGLLKNQGCVARSATGTSRTSGTTASVFELSRPHFYLWTLNALHADSLIRRRSRRSVLWLREAQRRGYIWQEK